LQNLPVWCFNLFPFQTTDGLASRRRRLATTPTGVKMKVILSSHLKKSSFKPKGWAGQTFHPGWPWIEPREPRWVDFPMSRRRWRMLQKWSIVRNFSWPRWCEGDVSRTLKLCWQFVCVKWKPFFFSNEMLLHAESVENVNDERWRKFFPFYTRRRFVALFILTPTKGQ